MIGNQIIGIYRVGFEEFSALKVLSSLNKYCSLFQIPLIMIKSRSSVESPFFANSCGWACAICITVVAAIAIFQVFISIQSHIHEEVASIAINQLGR
jgi:hypothetical protein